MSYVSVNLDQGTWAWLQVSVWVAVGLAIAVVAVFVFHLVTEYRTPEESKKIRDASHKRKPGMLLASDAGTGIFRYADRVGNEGYLTTKNEGKWKFHFTALTPRPGKVPESIDVATGKDIDKTRTVAEYINYLNTKKLHLQGARIPLWIGVPSKSIVASVFAIAGVQITEKIESNWADLANLLDIQNDIFPIDVSAMKTMVVSSSYNESQINSIESDSEHIGEERAKKAGFEKWFIFGGIAMMIIGAVMLGIAAFIS